MGKLSRLSWFSNKKPLLRDISPILQIMVSEAFFRPPFYANGGAWIPARFLRHWRLAGAEWLPENGRGSPFGVVLSLLPKFLNLK